MRRDRLHPTLLAARRFTRRTLLGRTAGAAAVAPIILTYGCSKGPGAVNLLMWSDEWPDPVLPNFTQKTGITVNKTLFSQNEEQIARLKAPEAAYDICQPTRDRAPQYKQLGVLAAWDQQKVPLDALLPYMLDS